MALICCGAFVRARYRLTDGLINARVNVMDEAVYAIVSCVFVL